MQVTTTKVWQSKIVIAQYTMAPEGDQRDLTQQYRVALGSIKLHWC